MNKAPVQTIIVGPCPCRGCGKPVWWCRTWHDSLAWYEAWAENRHRCAGKAVVA